MVGIKGKSGSGGKRTGAGRPIETNHTVHINITIEKDLLEYVDNRGTNRSRAISACIKNEKERGE